MTTHLNWDTINDVADGRLSPAEQTRASEHLARCAACSTQLSSLRAMLAAAGDATGSVEPPELVWADIARAIDASKSVAFPAASRREHGFHLTRPALAAAALVLIAGSSAITALILRGRGGITAGADSTATVLMPTSMPNDLVVMESEYLSTATTLREALDKARTTLSPSTIATVERNLKVIDDAIAEARDALVLDPSNGSLREALRKSHQQKIDFLRRTTTLLGEA
ncbi:MAG: zf-HC2 domain-containing protein [Gemmatimonadaceae bacterium]|nr:zf-HC2 domain-containing protein [Gemmatimonadaceae bacterium]